jgi:hypothetical protein
MISLSRGWRVVKGGKMVGGEGRTNGSDLNMFGSFVNFRTHIKIMGDVALVSYIITTKDSPIALAGDSFIFG